MHRGYTDHDGVVWRVKGGVVATAGWMGDEARRGEASQRPRGADERQRLSSSACTVLACSHAIRIPRHPSLLAALLCSAVH